MVQAPYKPIVSRRSVLRVGDGTRENAQFPCFDRNAHPISIEGANYGNSPMTAEIHFESER